MARPRVHNLDLLMDTAESLAVTSGASAVTVRALSDATGVSNGAIYHAFGSRAGLAGSVWLRAARRFLELQNTSVDVALTSETCERTRAIEAVVAAADAPAQFLLTHPSSARFLLAVRRSELLGDGDVPGGVADDLRALDDVVTATLVRLTRAVWGRGDREAIAVIRDCVVELPAALLMRGQRTPDPAVRARLAAAVRAVLTLTPPEPTPSPETTKGPPS